MYFRMLSTLPSYVRFVLYSWYRFVQNLCNTVLDLRAQRSPYMEGSELSDSHIRRALSNRVL